METRYFALIFGIVYAIVGVLGFVPALLQPPPPDAPPVAVTTLYGYLFGIFAVNVVHSLVHLGLGIWGVIAYASFAAARTYAASLAVIFGVLTIMGIIPGLWNMFGLAPLWGADVWLHAVTAVIAAYFGFGRRRGALEDVEATRTRRAA